MTEPVAFHDGRVVLHAGDCLDILKTLPDASIDSVVTDPPYALVSIAKRFGKDGAAPAKVPEGGSGAYMRASAGFMNKRWDTGDRAFAVEFWFEVLRVLKPGGHVLAFSSTRTYHRLACAIEDAGFEIRDQIGWLYASGFPKSHDPKKGAGASICRCAPCDDRVCGLREAQDDAGCLGAPHKVADMLAAVQRRSEGQGVGSTREQGISCSQVGGQSVRREERRLEGRGDLSPPAGELRVGSLCEVPGGPCLNGACGRLCDGAPIDHGSSGWTCPNQDGVRASSGSCAAEQRALQSRIVAGQPESQAGGAWEGCARCGKPIVPDGLGTALKPAWEPVAVARKPLAGTVAETVLTHGTGALNIDGCRIGTEGGTKGCDAGPSAGILGNGLNGSFGVPVPGLGRWPANVVHDASDKVLAAFRDEAARFFFSAKADADDRIGSKHPTVKPVDLMRWMVRLVTPPGGTVLDPFAGTGTTGEAAWREGFRAVLVEREEEYRADIARRMALTLAGPALRRAASAKARDRKPSAPMALFGEA